MNENKIINSDDNVDKNNKKVKLEKTFRFF